MKPAVAAGLLMLTACARAPSPTPDEPNTAATPTLKEPPVDTQETQVTLTSQSSPTAKVGGLTLTLLDLIEVAEPRDGKQRRFHRAKLHLEVGSDSRDVFLTTETTVMGYTLRLHSAGDGQANPHAPREGTAVIAVRPAR